MTLQQLRYFLAATERGSFSAAAEELHLAQPSLSEQVRRLEAELGVALFTRVGRGLVLTEAGRELRPHAERVLADVEAARESVSAVRGLRGGIATFGTWGTARFFPGSDFIADFRRRYPGCGCASSARTPARSSRRCATASSRPAWWSCPSTTAASTSSRSWRTSSSTSARSRPGCAGR